MQTGASGVDGTVAGVSLTVILVNFRSLAHIVARLESGALQGHHVIVVDNGDDAEGVTAACERHGATALLLKDNLGFAAAVNRAVATVENPTRPWLLLNPDAHVTEQQVEQLAAALRAGVDGVAPLLASQDGRLQIGPGGGELTLKSVATYFLFLAHAFPRQRGVFLTRAQSRRAHEVAWLCMACVLLQPQVFARFGAIPEDELVYAEDVSWGTSASLQGAHFELVPDILVRHDQGASGGSGQWIDALKRLCRARLGPWRGRGAVAAISVGLAARQLVGRRVT
jgi:N-acetylglucosaminyl-diphospho-decaprenol L-rhamnosyltransferase